MTRHILTTVGFFFVFIAANPIFGSKIFECEDVGIFANPDDCASYFMCSFGIGGFDVQRFDCEETYLFDVNLKVCSFDYAVDCGDRPRPGKHFIIRKYF
jgi:hypothetical protein